MSATELAVVMNYVVSLQQQQAQLIQQVQRLQEHVISLERKSTHADRCLLNLQTRHADLRADHDNLDYQVRLELSHALDEAANLKSLAVADSDYCEQRSLADCWSQRYPEAFE